MNQIVSGAVYAFTNKMIRCSISVTICNSAFKFPGKKNIDVSFSVIVPVYLDFYYKNK